MKLATVKTMKKYDEKIRKSESLNEVFEIVKDIIADFTGYERNGIKLRILNLGTENNRFVGGFYNYHTNVITINSEPIDNLFNSNPKLVPYYVFHVLLHEYIHALGVYDEIRTRKIAYLISRKCFGEEHVLTQLASNIGQFIPQLVKSYRRRQDLFDDFLEYPNEIEDFFEREIFEDFDRMMHHFLKEFNGYFDDDAFFSNPVA
ncbi:MAG: hypothetical protein Q7S27_02915 [Nanoarchaeota archaeon]|nr:hypothetical protein [Nanoarchaeota archaeon]